MDKKCEHCEYSKEPVKNGFDVSKEREIICVRYPPQAIGATVSQMGQVGLIVQFVYPKVGPVVCGEFKPKMLKNN